MKLESLLIAAVLSTTLICEAQDQQPAAPAATAPPAASAPSAIGTPSPATTTSPTTTAALLAAGKLADTNVWKEGAVSGSFLVRPDGVITMPLLGEVMAAGFTPVELGAQITAKLRKFLQDPLVEVTVIAIHSKNIYMMGESSRKGPMELSPGMTLLQAIGAAGLTEDANTKKMYILRDENGKRIRIPLHYKEALKGNMQYDIPLKAGDTIVVP